MIDVKISQIANNSPLPLDIKSLVEVSTPDLSSTTGYSTTKTPLANIQSIAIPQVQLSIHSTDEFGGGSAELRASYLPTDQKFLLYNPEIWLFRYKSKKGRKLNLETELTDNHVRKSNAHFAHTCHQNGVKYANSKHYSGSIRDSSGALLNGRNTEWTCPNKPYKQVLLDINPLDYYSVTTPFPFTESVNPSEKYELRMKLRGNRLTGVAGLNGPRAIILKFAIVIDNPDTTSPYKKLFGVLSDTINLSPFYKIDEAGLKYYFGFRYRKQVQMGKNINGY